MPKRRKYIEIWQPIKSRRCDHDVTCRVRMLWIIEALVKLFAQFRPA